MDSTIDRIVREAATLPPDQQLEWVARQAIAAVRADDAAIADQALESELKAFWRVHVHPSMPISALAKSTHLAWAKHLLRRGRPEPGGD